VIVLDASAAIEWLLQTAAGRNISSQFLYSSRTLHAPHLIDVEVAQVLRRYVVTGIISSERAEMALRDLSDLRLMRYPHLPLMERVWQLRDNLTAYDALYVALSERLNARLITRDHARIHLV
jgi:predicted nucleic acid-binding protein